MINVKTIIFSGGACPYQIEGITDDDKEFYLRYRGGWLRAGATPRPFLYDNDSYNIISEKVGDDLDGSVDPVLFMEKLKDKVTFPEGFEFRDMDIDYSPEFGMSEKMAKADQVTNQALQDLFDDNQITNREFKFRLWNSEDNKWDNPALLEVWNKNGQLLPLYDSQKYIIEQITGVFDSKSTLIYEGDIIHYTEQRIGWISFFAGSFVCNWNDQTEDELGKMVTLSMKIVGNIHENPELY